MRVSLKRRFAFWKTEGQTNSRSWIKNMNFATFFGDKELPGKLKKGQITSIGVCYVEIHEF